VTMRVVLGGMRRRVISSAFQRRVALGDRGPFVSFTFDDFPRSALTIGGHLLKSFGVRGTFYTAMGLMDSVTELGEQFSQVDLETLLGDGHELGHHTFGHVSCRSMAPGRFTEEVIQGRAAVRKLAGAATQGNFAFPFGEVTLRGKRLVGREVASARGIWPGFNGPIVDLNLLWANSLYGDGSSCSRVKELILENERRRSWIIFYTHDVRPTPSRYGCTPDLLECAVGFAAQRGARILPIAEVVAELVSQSHAIASRSTPAESEDTDSGNRSRCALSR
jgi:peptidoglycan/xylan/chitin deacetylase (PgdA/CDA1 family)